MAKKSTVENQKLLSKLQGGKSLFEKHKDDETVQINSGDLPPGIEGGIAELTTLKIGEYQKGDNQGELYFQARGVVVYPIYHDGIKIAGRQTMIMEPLHETEGRTRETVEDHFEWMLNMLRLLGMDTKTMSFENMEELMEKYATHADVKFEFRTWIAEATERYPNPRTQQQWIGMVEEENLPKDFYEATQGEAEVEDNTAPNEEEETQQEEEPAPAPTKPKPKAKKPDPEPKAEEAADEISSTDIAALADMADEGDEEAQKALQEMALAAGIDQEAIDGAESWEAVGTELNKLRNDQAEAADGGDKPSPKRGEVYQYYPIGKNGKPLTKAVECEVVKVDDKAETVELKNLTNPKISYKDVAWGKLIAEDEIPY